MSLFINLSLDQSLHRSTAKRAQICLPISMNLFVRQFYNIIIYTFYFLVEIILYMSSTNAFLTYKYNGVDTFYISLASIYFSRLTLSFVAKQLSTAYLLQGVLATLPFSLNIIKRGLAHIYVLLARKKINK